MTTDSTSIESAPLSFHAASGHPIGRVVMFDSSDCAVEDFDAIVSADTDEAAQPLANRFERGIGIYDAATLLEAASNDRRSVIAELATALASGPGVLVVEGAVDHDAVDAASAAFDRIIERERAELPAAGDHFAAAGANSRVWNSLEKLCIEAPDVFVDYYASVAVSLVATAWLGPGYQMTAQVNVVHPGGQAQSPHRDYHLGFMEDDRAAAYPSHIHALSPALTLQGAIAHHDMSVASGPTKLLPHSQKYLPGYVAWRRPDFIDYFEQHNVQLPLGKGDAVFFNPALFHAAGANETADVHRMANLLQICSAFTRAMETVDRDAMAEAALPALRAFASTRERAETAAAVAAIGDGYAFPANLDVDQPVSGLAPPSGLELLESALGLA